MIRICTIVLIFAFSLSVSVPAFAGNIPSTQASGLTVSIVRNVALSTSKQRIYSVNVAYSASTVKHNVLLYIDGKYSREFKGVNVPFTFDENLTGLSNGKHELSIQLENLDGKMLAEAKTSLNLIAE